MKNTQIVFLLLISKLIFAQDYASIVISKAVSVDEIGGHPITSASAIKFPRYYDGTALSVSTFHSIGLYWSGSGGSANTVCNVQYREVGSSSWKNGYPLVFDNRPIGGRPANEYRGSLVNLTPGTNYEIQLTAGSAVASLTTSTWSDNFPACATPITLNSPTTISTSGTPSCYRVYTGKIDGGTNNIFVNASYIIIRNMMLTGAGEDAIVLGQNAHHVVIEGNDISGWGYVGMGGNNQGAVRIKGFSYNASNVKQIIVQRNKLHDSRDNSNSWDPSGHPLGPNAITFDESGGNHVIRYNDIYNSSASKKFMDGIGGGDNFTFTGAPGANSDIYANKIEDVYDDAIEAEGSGMNVRIWGNWMNNTFTGIATATVSIGPMYVFNNISNVSVRSAYNASAGTIDNEDRGPFNKCGSQDASYRGGRTFLFHNTVLQPTESGYAYPRGMGGGPVDNGGPVANVFSRNNIWQTYRTNHPAIGEWQTSSNSGNSYNYDLYNGSLQIATSGTQEANGINGTPTYAAGVPLSGPNPSGYFLASGSNGVDRGQPLNNFNDGYTGSGPDIGAYEIGKPALQFGVNAYLTTEPPPPPTNQPPVANAQEDQVLTLPANSTTLTGIATDPDGNITSATWSKISGPSATLVQTGVGTATVSNMVKGIYTFRLTVTDDKGATATDDMTVTVNDIAPPPNKFPTANAGRDTTIYVPASSVLLKGSGTDPDGSIMSYAWSKISGPSSFVFASANAASTTLSNLVKGNYIIRLTVTDNGNATAIDDMTVTVNDTTTAPPPATAIKIKSISKRSGNSRTSHKVSVNKGDLVVITTACETSQRNALIGGTGSLKFTKQADASAYKSGDAELYTTVATSTGTVTITSDWGSWFQSSVVYVITNYESALSGAKKIAVNQSLPSATITTKENSLVIAVTSDWRANDGTDRRYRDNVRESAYAFSEKKGTFYHYSKVSNKVQTYTLGLKSPGGMNASTILFVIDSK